VLVSGVDRYLDKDLWTPQAFSREFGNFVVAFFFYFFFSFYIFFFAIDSAL